MKSLKTVVKHRGIVKKFGNWSLELLPSGRIQASNGWINASITLYGIAGYTWASDTPELLPDSVTAWLHDNHIRLEKVQAEYLEYLGGYYKPDIAFGMLDEDYWANFELTQLS